MDNAFEEIKDEVQQIEFANSKLNNLPRKCLNFLTPNEAWNKYHNSKCCTPQLNVPTNLLKSRRKCAKHICRFSWSKILSTAYRARMIQGFFAPLN
jgi:hypothetical protein